MYGHAMEVVYRADVGFARVLESPGILLWRLVLESSVNLLNSS